MIKITKNEPLSNHTSIRIGGMADFFVTAETGNELKEAVIWARDNKVPYYILGGGSNTIFADEGYRGLIINQRSRNISFNQSKDILPLHQIKARYNAAKLKFELGYDDWHANRLVTVDAGYPLPALIKDTLTRGLVGLEWFAGIPGNIGGAIVGNIHGGPRFFGNRVQSVNVLDEELEEVKLDWSELEFDYDWSLFKKKKMPILSVDMGLYSANHDIINKAKSFARTWVIYKSSKWPKDPNCGSIFQNISSQDAETIGLPTSSAGWLIDSVGLKGHRIGNVSFSPDHANYIINLGNGKSSDFLSLIKLAREKVKQKFGINLLLEITLVETDE